MLLRMPSKPAASNVPSEYLTVFEGCNERRVFLCCILDHKGDEVVITPHDLLKTINTLPVLFPLVDIITATVARERGEGVLVLGNFMRLVAGDRAKHDALRCLGERG